MMKSIGKLLNDVVANFSIENVIKTAERAHWSRNLQAYGK